MDHVPRVCVWGGGEVYVYVWGRDSQCEEGLVEDAN